MNNDLISASHIIKILSSLVFADDEIRAGNQAAINAVIKIVVQEPFVDAEPVRHGGWINGVCSTCGAPIPTDSKDDYIGEDENYFCYCCGAKMDGEDESKV